MARLTQLGATIEEARAAGRDATMHGPNTTNCHFKFFATPALTAAWEEGRNRITAEQARGKRP